MTIWVEVNLASPENGRAPQPRQWLFELQLDKWNELINGYQQLCFPYNPYTNPSQILFYRTIILHKNWYKPEFRAHPAVKSVEVSRGSDKNTKQTIPLSEAVVCILSLPFSRDSVGFTLSHHMRDVLHSFVSSFYYLFTNFFLPSFLLLFHSFSAFSLAYRNAKCNLTQHEATQAN